MHHIKRNFLLGTMMAILLVGFLCPVSTFAQKASAYSTVRNKAAAGKKKSNVQNSGGLSAWLNVCRTMGINVNKKGFRYSYESHAHSYNEALSGSRKTNCSKFVSWCLQEYGALEQGQTFYVMDGRIKKKFKTWDKTKVSVFKVYKHCSAAGLQPGDVVCWAGKPHSCIYAGRDRHGRRLWFDAGRQNTYGKCSGSRFRRITASPSKYLDRRTVGYIIRIKGL